MKNNSSPDKLPARALRKWPVLLLAMLFPLFSLAQADTTAPAMEEPAAEADASLIAPSLEFKGLQTGNNNIALTAALKAKVKGNFVKLSLLKVTFFRVTDSGDTNLGFVITDRMGMAKFNCNTEGMKPGTDSALHFKAVFAGNKYMDPAEEELAIRRGKIELTPVKEDSLLTMQVKFTDELTGKPVEGITVGIFVKRMFRPLKVGEGVTDGNGEAIVEIPANLPGDAKGNLTFYGKLDEHEQYGNIETAVVQQWGRPVSDKIEDQPRALWSQHPPLWMLITFIVLMVTVWGHYIVIVFELFRLRKEEPHTAG